MVIYNHSKGTGSRNQGQGGSKKPKKIKKVLDKSKKFCYNNYRTKEMSQKPRLTHKKDEVSNMKNAMTYAQALEIAINAVADNADAASTLTALKAQIEKKNTSKPSKPTKAQTASAEKREGIFETLKSQSEPITAGSLAEILGITTQSVSGHLRQLAEAGRVEVIKETTNEKGEVKKLKSALYKAIA